MSSRSNLANIASTVEDFGNEIMCFAMNVFDDSFPEVSKRGKLKENMRNLVDNKKYIRADYIAACRDLNEGWGDMDFLMIQARRNANDNKSDMLLVEADKMLKD